MHFSSALVTQLERAAKAAVQQGNSSPPPSGEVATRADWC